MCKVSIFMAVTAKIVRETAKKNDKILAKFAL